MEELLSNFYIIIPIVIVIALRIMASRKPPAGKPEEAVSPPERRPPPEAVPVMEPAVKPLAPELKAPLMVRATTNLPQGFPDNLEYLPPLKRAVVLTEILGAPKGLE
jgi:hypothetical protein